MAIDKTESTENIDSYKRVREPLSPQGKTGSEMNRFFLCFFFYFGFDGLSNLFGNFSGFIKTLGMDFHFKSMSRGVLDTRDIIYFISITILFLAGTVYQLKSLKW